MSLFRMLCFLLTKVMAISTLTVGLIFSSSWKRAEDNKTIKEKIELSFDIISVLLLLTSIILVIVSIISGMIRTRKLIILSTVLLLLALGFLCASNVLLFIKNGVSYRCWIFASLWTTAACIPFAMSTIYIEPIQMERL